MTEASVNRMIQVPVLKQRPEGERLGWTLCGSTGCTLVATLQMAGTTSTSTSTLRIRLPEMYSSEHRCVVRHFGSQVFLNGTTGDTGDSES
jgi:hypothetical protein